MTLVVARKVKSYDKGFGGGVAGGWLSQLVVLGGAHNVGQEESPAAVVAALPCDAVMPLLEGLTLVVLAGSERECMAAQIECSTVRKLRVRCDVALDRPV